MPDDDNNVAAQTVPTGALLRRYNYSDWYWLADDGRVFASARQLTVDVNDPDYVAFLDGGPATPWPKDDAGQQTDVALQAVFDSYDIKTGGVATTFSVNSKK